MVLDMQKCLVVFVHGLGADDKNWWGSTKSVIKLDSELSIHYDFIFFDYKTEKLTNLTTRLLNTFGLGSKLASIQDLGGQLVTSLNNHNNNYSTIKLFGHSMGGLVISAALHKLKLENEIFNKVTDIAFCGTPLGGSNLANTVSSIFRLSSSKHLKSLKVNSDEIKSIVNVLPQLVTLQHNDNKALLKFFKITEDQVVTEDFERYGIFEKDITNNVTTTIDLTKNHCQAVQNLNQNDDNYKAIKKWILRNKNVEKNFYNTPHLNSLYQDSVQDYSNNKRIESLDKLNNDFMFKVEKNADIKETIYISKDKVSQKLYFETLYNKSTQEHSTSPITNINWFDAIKFCNLLSEKFGVEKYYIFDNEKVSLNKKAVGFRLPFINELKYLFNNNFAVPTLNEKGHFISEWGNDSKARYERGYITSYRINNKTTYKRSWHIQGLANTNIGFRIIHSIIN